MSVQRDEAQRVGHFIRLLEQECKAWQETADNIQALLASVSPSKIEEAKSRVRQCRARAQALRKLVTHVCKGDFTLLEHPES
jgi:hypothetical protein